MQIWWLDWLRHRKLYSKIYFDITGSKDLHSIVYEMKDDFLFDSEIRFAFYWYKHQKEFFINLAETMKNFLKRVSCKETSNKKERGTISKTTRAKKPRNLKRVRKTGKKALYVPFSLSMSNKARQEIEALGQNQFDCMSKAFKSDYDNLRKWCARNGHYVRIYPKLIRYKAVQDANGNVCLVYEPHIQGNVIADCMAVLDKLEDLWCDGENHKMGYKRNNKSGVPSNFWIGNFFDYEKRFDGWIGYLNTSHNIGEWKATYKAGGAYGKSKLNRMSMWDIWDILKQGDAYFQSWASGLVAFP